MKGESTMATRPARGSETPAAAEHRFLELIPPGTSIDFVGLRFKMLVLSWAVITAGLAWSWVKGINYGIDTSILFYLDEINDGHTIDMSAF